jgi:hypothetical protein
MTIAAAGFGTIEAGAAQPGQARSFGALKQIDAGVLNIGYAEVRPTAGPSVIRALHDATATVTRLDASPRTPVTFRRFNIGLRSTVAPADWTAR